jgi:molybdopterin-containing oxidoreductase family iron-sulfur binding subunit
MSNRKNLTLDWNAIDRRLATGGPEYWRGLEELADTEAFQELLEREFPEQAHQWTNRLSRRRFLLLMGASLGLAGLSGCRVQPPVGRILPYDRQPEELTPGKPLFFATAMTLGGIATGLLVESHEGRPTKVEGNPRHPASHGATDVFAQASILGLYDPERSQSVTYRGRPRTWDDAVLAIRKALAEQRKSEGTGLRILTETITSPTLADQLLGKRDGAVLKEFPKARWIQYDPARSHASLAGAQRFFGEQVDVVHHFEEARVVVSLDADFLACGPAHLRDIRDFMKARRVGEDSQRDTMNRLYAIESTPTLTGAAADHRLPLAARAVAGFARALAAELGVAGVKAPMTLTEEERRWVAVLAKDLRSQRGASIVVAGDGQPAFVHALVHAMNHSLGNLGKTIVLIDPVEAQPRDQIADLRELVEEMKAGDIKLLLVLGGNPVFTASADIEFEKQLQNVPLRLHLGLYQDETAVQCHWHIPEAHYLESWSDARAYDGTVSIIQPLIAPLYGGRSAHEVLGAFFDPAGRPGYQIVRSYWREHWPKKTAGDFERDWERALHDGLIVGTAFEPKEGLKPQEDWAVGQPESKPATEGFEIIFRPDPAIYDGRFANNGWLQELPRPLTKLTWDNAAIMSPATARALGLKETFGSHGGEHGEALVDRVELEYRGRTIEAPVWILPGHPDDSITVHFGHGRTRAGRVGNGTGFDAYRLRTSAEPWFDAGLRVKKTGRRSTLACTQMHHSMQERDPVHATTLREVLAKSRAESPEAEKKNDPRLHPLTLYTDPPTQPAPNQWGMAIDLTACIGCSACVVACQAENNIPVVGKREVIRGREMHWLRIDRYYKGELSNPKVYFQPVPCMHCENAPCELVCPVGATVHSADGLNDMVYNRCVGTRYCSNNCPYKVRRFNFLAYADDATESLKLGRNPGVTVRSRGVMEKCTYCVQRIRAAQIEADVAGRALRDGDVLTACQAACPAQAITFGDLSDPASRVSKKKAGPLHYALLEGLNTRPRTTYLAALRNPNPELE